MSDFGLPGGDQWWPQAPQPQGGGPRRGRARRRAASPLARLGTGGVAASAILAGAPKFLKALGPRAAAAGARFLPGLGWATTIGVSLYELQQLLLGNQVEAVKNETNINTLLAEERRRSDQALAIERNRQNARDVAAAYVRGLSEAAAKIPPPAPPVVTGNIGTVTLPPPTAKQKLAALWAKTVASPLFLPIVGALIAKAAAPRSASSPPSDFPIEDLTGFQEGPVEFLGGQLGGTDPEFMASIAPETEAALAPGCEEIDPPRVEGQCRQGWFAETPSKIFFKEWSRRPCQ